MIRVRATFAALLMALLVLVGAAVLVGPSHAHASWELSSSVPVSAESVAPQAQARYALIGGNGRLYPASASGAKLASTWSRYAFDSQAIDMLFVAADAAKVPYSVRVALDATSFMTVNVKGLSSATRLVFLLDAQGRSACRSIAPFAFKDCSSLKRIVNLGATSLVRVGNRTFNNCIALRGPLSLPGTCKHIGKGAFAGCKKLGRVDFSKSASLARIGSRAFFRAGVTKVALPDSCAKVGSEAFSRCVNLKSFASGAGTKLLGKRAFAGCKRLSKVVLNGKRKVVRAGAGLFEGTKMARGKAKITVRKRLLEKYRARAANARKASPWRGCKFKAGA